MHSGYYRTLRNIQRFPLIHMNKPQSIAEHCYGVAMLCSRMANALDGVFMPVDKGLLLDRALYHDIPQALTGVLSDGFRGSLRSITSLEDIEKSWMRETEEDNLTEAESYAIWGPSQVSMDATKLPMTERLLSFADALEFFMTTLDELSFGNSSVEEISRRAFEVAWNRFSFLFTDSERSALLILTEVSMLIETANALSEKSQEVSEE
jgi:5'-deoxynucleotidase YfbR-like HD superfamily hydrolase